MSHALSVVQAFDRDFAAIDIPDFLAKKPNGTRLPESFETLRGDRPILGDMKVFLIPGQRGWGQLVLLPEDPAAQDQIPIHRGFLEMVAQIPKEPGAVVLSMLFGYEHSMLSIVEHSSPYDFVLPGRPAITPLPGRQILPWPVIQAQLRQMMRPMAAVMAYLRSLLPSARLLHCAPPPPIGSEEQILTAREFEREREELARIGITPASIRLKYYLAQLDELDSIAIRCGVTLLKPPAAALTGEGLLRPEFWNGATHANAAYGDLVLGQIERVIRGNPA